MKTCLLHVDIPEEDNVAAAAAKKWKAKCGGE